MIYVLAVKILLPPFVLFQMVSGNDTFYMPGINFSFTLVRRPLHYLLNIIIPCITLAALSAFNFAVPVDSGERLSLGISILLAFSVFMLILQDNTPQADAPLLGTYTTGRKHDTRMILGRCKSLKFDANVFGWLQYMIDASFKRSPVKLQELYLQSQLRRIPYSSNKV